MWAALLALLISCAPSDDVGVSENRARVVPARLAFIQAEQAKADGRFALTNHAESASVHSAHTALKAKVRFDRKGMRLRLGGSTAVTMRLGAIGRDGAGPALRPAEAADELEVAANRVTMHHGHGVQQWWVNGPLGLEHGFTLIEPTAPTDGGTLVLRVDVTGATVAPDGKGGARLRPMMGGLASLRYTDLFAEDASGAQLPAEMRVATQHIELRINDLGARYPLHIDPLVWSETAKLLASNGLPNARFGESVAVSGDYLIVGAPEERNNTVNGFAYIYERNGAGQWLQEPLLAAFDEDPTPFQGNLFGTSVSISGTYALVGAADDNLPATSRGSAYVYERDGAGDWIFKQKLSGDSGITVFGTSVAVSGDYAIVGAPFDNDGGNNAGAAYIYERDAGGTWNEVTKLLAVGSANEDQFGNAVAISGDYAIVGCYLDDDTFVNQGSAFVFERDGAGTWLPEPKLVPMDIAGADNFGISVAISGDRAVIGSYHDDDNGTDSGSAYVFERNAAGMWLEDAKLTSSDGSAQDLFGSSVAISGDVALAGAVLDGFDRGSAYIFERDAAGAWMEQPKVEASDADNGDQFGSAVAIDGPYAVFGARADEDDAGFLGGSAYVLEGVMQGGGPGTSCALPGDCASGFCVDAVCCDAACGDSAADDCQACSVAEGSSTDGACEPIALGTVCRAGIDECDADEQCTGSDNACPVDMSEPDGTTCNAGNGECNAGTCDAVGQGGAGGGGGSAATGGSSATGGSAANGGSPSDSGSDSAEPGPKPDEGCGCRLAGTDEPQADAPWWLLSALLLAPLRRRRRVG